MFILFLSIAIFMYKYTISSEYRNYVDFFQEFLFLKYILIYIFTLEILKLSLNDFKRNDIYFNQSKYSNTEIKILSMFSAFPFALGVSSFFQTISDKNLNTLPISQGMSINILLYPTTLASAYMFDYFHINSLLNTFMY